MTENMSTDALSRRRFLRAAGLAGAGAALVARPGIAGEAPKPDPLITEVQDWHRYIGDGVEKHPYGSPSTFA